MVEIERIMAENARLRDILREFIQLKWISVEKDNMEFQAKATCFTLEKARAILDEQLKPMT